MSTSWGNKLGDPGRASWPALQLLTGLDRRLTLPVDIIVQAPSELGPDAVARGVVAYMHPDRTIEVPFQPLVVVGGGVDRIDATGGGAGWARGAGASIDPTITEANFVNVDNTQIPIRPDTIQPNEIFEVGVRYTLPFTTSAD